MPLSLEPSWQTEPATRWALLSGDSISSYGVNLKLKQTNVKHQLSLLIHPLRVGSYLPFFNLLSQVDYQVQQQVKTLRKHPKILT